MRSRHQKLFCTRLSDRRHAEPLRFQRVSLRVATGRSRIAGAAMSRLTTGIFGIIALSLTFGAVQFAMGRDLSGSVQPISSIPAADLVNRFAKADRVTAVAVSGAPTQTISLQLNGVSDTSVLVRIPATRKAASSPASLKSGGGAPTLACEPVVSVLTEVAKQLGAGRCVT